MAVASTGPAYTLSLIHISAFFRDLGIVMLQGYGITECSPLVAVNREKYYNDSSVGPILPCCEVKIDGGEILVRGDNVTVSYTHLDVYKRQSIRSACISAGLRPAPRRATSS